MKPALQNLTFAAMHEVAHITGVAIKLDHESDEARLVLPSLMARIRTLSEAVAAVVTLDLASMPLHEFWHLVHGQAPTPAELTSLDQFSANTQNKEVDHG